MKLWYRPPPLSTAALAFTLALAVLVVAASAEERVARLGVVLTMDPGIQLRGYSGFWDHLKELGWTRGKNSPR